MDIRREGWFGQLVISGSAKPSAHRGSIMGIISESLKDIAISRVRADADGDSEIIIRIRNKSFDTSRESSKRMDLAADVESLVFGDSVQPDQPLENEEYADFYDRLINLGYPQASAMLIAAEWFEREADGLTVQWLNDPKAIRFRELNTRNEAFEAAIPTEYENLKHYVLEIYPTFVEHMTFRTA